MTPNTEHLGKYELRREVGRGSMGVVFEAHDPVIDRRVALKMIRPDDFGSVQGADLVARLRREAQAAGRLNHPGIVAIHDFGESDGTAYIAMEFVDGRELRSALDAGGRYMPAEAARIVLAVLAALQHAHERGVTHRDIKPANIILLADGSLKIADFGVARIEASDLTQAGTIIGTPMYMSPEQILGLPADARSDLFSCGVLLYELLTGKRPFNGSVATVIHQVLEVEPAPPSRLAAELGPQWDAVIARAIAKKPEQRFASAREMSAAVERAARVVGEDPDATVALPRPAAGSMVAGAAASVAPAPPATPRESSRNGARMIAIAAGLAATVGAAAVAWRYAGPDAGPSPHHAASAAGPHASAPGPLTAAASSTPGTASSAVAMSPAPAPAPAPASAPAPATAPSPAPPPTLVPAKTPVPPPATAPVVRASPAPPVVAPPNEWSQRLDPARLDAAPQPTTLSAALRRVLDPFDQADLARLSEYDSLLAQQTPPHAVALGVLRGRLVQAHAGGTDASSAAAAARRRCSDTGAEGCAAVWVDGRLRRQTMYEAMRKLGSEPSKVVRSAWMQSIAESARELRAAAQAATSAPRPASTAAPAPPPVPSHAASAPRAAQAASAPTPADDWTRARVQLRQAQGLAGGLAALLGVESAADRQSLEKLQSDSRRWRWKSAMAMGENASGHLVWSSVQAESRDAWAEER